MHYNETKEGFWGVTVEGMGRWSVEIFSSLIIFSGTMRPRKAFWGSYSFTCPIPPKTCLPSSAFRLLTLSLVAPPVSLYQLLTNGAAATFLICLSKTKQNIWIMNQRTPKSNVKVGFTTTRKECAISKSFVNIRIRRFREEKVVVLRTFFEPADLSTNKKIGQSSKNSEGLPKCKGTFQDQREDPGKLLGLHHTDDDDD